MKRFNKVILSLTITGLSLSGIAQTPKSQRVLDPQNMREGEDVEYCIQHKKMAELLKNPANFKIWQAQQQELKNNIKLLENDQNKSSRGVIYTIPIVFHILHNNGSENISDAQVLDALEILNEDFRLLNTDAANVNSQFAGMPTDAEIEFVLATKAPDGSCFSGITRTVSAQTSSGDGSAQVTAIRNGNDVYNGTWPERNYLNIFVCADIGGAAGYTFNPWGTGTGMSGIWILDTFTGSIGTGSTFRSRSLTHEVGHWLNLDHTWGNTNDPGVASNCNFDDDVADTPRCQGLTSCNLNANTCSNDANDGYWTSDVIDNTENYMEYSYCSKMFTPGQVTRMRAALISSAGGRNTLVSASNLSLVGATGNAPICEANFSGDRIVICEGESVQFTDESYSNPTGWTWTFTGGNPSSSTDQNPLVSYSTSGTYSVVLTATDGSTNKTTTKNAYVTVLPSTGRSITIEEGFETITVPSTEWLIENPDNSNAWFITTSAAATGNKSLRLNNSSNDEGDVDEFVSGTIDLSNVTDVELSFKYAFAKKTSTDADYMRIYVSNDCGETWSVRKNISSTVIATASNTSNTFIPTSSDWETVTITNITNTYWTENFRFKIAFFSGGGNNVYLDDINIYDPNSLGVLETEEISMMRLFPNPANDKANLSFDLKSDKEVMVFVTDMLGKQVQVVNRGNLNAGSHQLEINTNGLSRGIYFINVSIDGKLTTQKLILE